MQDKWTIVEVDGDRSWKKDSKADAEHAIQRFAGEAEFYILDPDGNEYVPPQADGGETPEESEEPEEPEESEAQEVEYNESETKEPEGEESAPKVVEATPVSRGSVNASKRVYDPEGIMPEWMKTDIIHGNGDKGIDLNKRGTQVVAESLNLEVTAECEVSATDTEFEYCRYRATVERPDGSTFNAVGDCHIDEKGKEKWDLERMAETRAKKRAVKWASGGGLALFRGNDE